MVFEGQNYYNQIIDIIINLEISPPYNSIVLIPNNVPFQWGGGRGETKLIIITK